MSTSIIDLQRNIFLQTIRNITRDDYMVLVVDEKSKLLLENVAEEDDILGVGISQIEQIEARRSIQRDSDAVYLLTPLPHIVECLKADLNHKRYRRSHVIWTTPLSGDLGKSLHSVATQDRLIADERVLNCDFFPQESHVVTFREPWSFQVLFNTACDSLVRQHLESLARRVVALCVSLGEYPLIRFYSPQNAIHAAQILCEHLAKYIQNGLDNYARAENNFPPQSPRPRAILLVTDRSMDLMSPLIHDLTYQAMAMDLLPIQDHAGKISYMHTIRRGQPDQEEKEVVIDEKDKIWVENRHLQMDVAAGKLTDDFRKFRAKNPQFDEADGQNISVNTIKDMLAGLPEYQQGKEAFSLHIDVADRCLKMYKSQNLEEVATLEQCFATGLDENNRRPRNVTDQLVCIFADERVVPDCRARLLMMYVIHKGGIFKKDITLLQEHGQLPDVYEQIISNLEAVGARVKREGKDKQNLYRPPFNAKKSTHVGEDVSIARFEPMLKLALENLCQGTLDTVQFPPVKPHLDDPMAQQNAGQTSLRSAGKPTWANTRPSANKPRQRIIVFMAGGATFAESRACYEISRQMGKEVFLATSHLTTPKRYVHQVSELSEPRQALDMPMNRRPPQLPSWLNEPPPGSTKPQQMRTPLEAMQNMNLGPPSSHSGSSRPGSASTAVASTMAGSFSPQLEHNTGKLKKDKKEKKHHLGFLRKH